MQPGTGRFVVLNDEPVEAEREDLLGAGETARALVDLITESRVSTPFTVAIDAGWGMGKSSLMRLLNSELGRNGVPTAWFNAWTSGPDALEVLIKSVLLRFDRNVVRRAYHRLIQRRRLVGLLRVAFALAAGFFGIRRLVDGLWDQLSVDAKSRNEIRDVVRDMARDWAGSGSNPRQLVVFVDDLDRCSGEVVLTVCEAIKLYLDVPGLVFVIGCDQGALARNIGNAAGSVQALEHLEKIVQVNYRSPTPDEDTVRHLIGGYARRSGTEALFGAGVTALIAQHTKRNPRRIKRLINSFVLEYHLNRDWRRFGASALVRVILLQHFYPDFYRMLAGVEGRDIMREFLHYSDVRAECKAGRRSGETRWTTFFLDHGAVTPPEDADREQMMAALAQAEKELPVAFPRLVTDAEFVSLVEELRAETHFDHLLTYLQDGRSPIATDANRPDGLSDGVAVQVGHAVPPPPMQHPQALHYQPGPSADDDYELGRDRHVQRHPDQGYPQQPGPAQNPWPGPPQPASPHQYAYGQAPQQAPGSPSPFPSQAMGLRLLWIDDDAAADTIGGTKGKLLDWARGNGMSIQMVSDLASAKQALLHSKPDLVVSDITRAGNTSAGLDDLQVLRTEQVYEGPVIFYTSKVTPSRIKRAQELGALGVTDDPEELVRWVETVASSTFPPQAQNYPQARNYPQAQNYGYPQAPPNFQGKPW